MQMTQLIPHHDLPCLVYCLVFEPPNGQTFEGKCLVFYEMAIVVLTQSWGWSYPCVSSLSDDGLQGGKIASEPEKGKFHCRQVIPSDDPESAMIQSLWQKDYKRVSHACLCLDDKSDGATLTKVITSGYGLYLRGPSPPAHFCLELSAAGLRMLPLCSGLRKLSYCS